MGLRLLAESPTQVTKPQNNDRRGGGGMASSVPEASVSEGQVKAVGAAVRRTEQVTTMAKSECMNVRGFLAIQGIKRCESEKIKAGSQNATGFQQNPGVGGKGTERM